MTRDELKTRIDAIEESYEFFLAYAAQGISASQAHQSEGQVRDFLEKMDAALDGLADGFGAVVEAEGLTPADAYRGVIEVLRQDAIATRAAVSLVRAQTAVSSQLVDNLNASIHVRALLTDLFLIDEALKSHTASQAAG